MIRPRRLRTTDAMRRLVREVRVHPAQLVLPVFVAEGLDAPHPISSMPGVSQQTLTTLPDVVEQAAAAGLGGIMLFGVPVHKDAVGSGATDPQGILSRAVEVAKAAAAGRLVVQADLCLDEFTDHGHCGVIGADGDVDNDRTLELYQKVAVAQAEAGVDICAPSGMMDGQVAAIRSALDSAGAQDTAILAYSAKYASALYGPFRDAVGVEIDGGEGVAGDRRGYQQDHRNLRESLLEIRDDVEQGADMVMVKPALSYLDVITAARGEVDVPLAAYHVSGEYAMVHAAAERGWLDLEAVAVEQTTAIKRAGADFVLTYFARLLAEMAADGGLR